MALYVPCLLSPKVFSVLIQNKNTLQSVGVVHSTATCARALLLFIQKAHAPLSL